MKTPAQPTAADRLGLPKASRRWRLTELCSGRTRSAKDIKDAAARRAGCISQAEIDEFLDPLPSIPNYVAHLPDYSRARDRLRDALKGKEKIVLYGDYDCDGITALVQLHDLLRSAQHPSDKLAWFIPDRMDDGYGLTDSGVQKCLELHAPQLLICVDCASTAIPQLKWLRAQTVDVIVIDHHHLAEVADDHPTCAHLNPRACRDLLSVQGESTESAQRHLKRLCDMSAAGLVFLFAEQFAKDAGISGWRRERALLLAGFGTLADVMPLTGNNRALVKGSLALANEEKSLAQIPGLKELDALCPRGADKKVTSATYGFQWGPRINASGRMDDAVCSVKLLLAETAREAEGLAKSCDSVNRDRQAEQERIVEEALAMAEEASESAKVFVLAKREWHPGIVGIVASKLKERFYRPAIVLGWDTDKNCWKGSGRSVDGFSLGEAVSAAQSEGLLAGGGHHAAAGMSIHEENLDKFRNWINRECPLSREQFIPHYTVVDVNCLNVNQWLQVMGDLEPFGNANPRIFLYLRSAKLVKTVECKTLQSVVWAIKGSFLVGQDRLEANWTALKRVAVEWTLNRSYSLILSVSKTDAAASARSYINWRVEDSDDEDTVVATRIGTSTPNDKQ